MSATAATSSTPRSSGLTPGELESIRPNVITLSQGRLAMDGELPTSQADVDRMFDPAWDKSLPQFVADHVPGPVPVVLWAHGGLVDEGAGLKNAHDQIDWWKSNGVYPVYFVWETGLAESLSALILPPVTRGARGFFSDAKDRIIELALHFDGGPAVWGNMKDSAANASRPAVGTQPEGGAAYFAHLLGNYAKLNPGKIAAQAIGHSAGAIFHSYLVPTALGGGVPHFDNVIFLAPAERVDLFKSTIVPEIGKRISRMSVFTMDRDHELRDNCLQVYNASLLYLISRALEPELDCPILGLQDSISADSGLRTLFGPPAVPASPADVVWTPTVATTGADASQATSHGDFDKDPDTMNSLATRVTGSFPAFPYPTDRGLGPDAWSSSKPLPLKPVDTRPKRALCIGINDYPGNLRLSGCVADAEAWGAQFETLGFDVEKLIDQDATRENILERILALVSESQSGDVVAIQYSGHGTYVPDLTGDDDASWPYEQALCPVDFLSGNLIIDDDLGAVFDLIPDGVDVTCFFDSCHSWEATRSPFPEADSAAPAADQGRRPRFVHPTEDMVAAYRAQRGTPSKADRRTSIREVAFCACGPREVAYETGGHGDFTAAAAILIVTAAGKVTNEDFLQQVLAKFRDQPKQNPELDATPVVAARPFLATLAPAAITLPGGVPTDANALNAETTMAHARAVSAAEFLRATADFIEGRAHE